MKIIHLISNKVWGGGEQYALDLCQSLKGDGHDVSIVSRRSRVVENILEDSGVEHTFMPLRGLLDIISPLRLSKMLSGDLRIIVHVHNFKDAVVATRARALSGNKQVKIVMTRHLVKPGKNTGSYRNLFSELDKIIFVSELAKNRFLSSDPPIDRDKIHVVLNGIKDPRSEDAKRASSKRVGIRPEVKPEAKRELEVRLMYHGRLSPEKGVEYLTQAMEKLKGENITLIVAGEGKGEYVMPILRRCKSMGISPAITWTGFVENVHPLIETTDIGIFPSVCEESFGLALVEYMAHGKPVITTATGAQKEIVTDGAEGVFVAEKDSMALANAIRMLAKDKDKRKQMSEKARKTYEERFAYPVFYSKILGIYNSVMQN